jgi:hypothetical protein
MFGKKEQDTSDPTTWRVTEKDELKEVDKIRDRLDSDEIVHVMAKQSRTKPGGAVIGTPNTVFATDKRIIIRNPTMLGMRENIEDYSYEKLTNIKLEKGLFSSTLVITAPGMGTAARNGLSTGGIAWGRGEDGMIDAIPKDKADMILRLVRLKMEAHRTGKNTVQKSSDDDPLKILKVRYAKGEISKEEYEDMKSALE